MRKVIHEKLNLNDYEITGKIHHPGVRSSLDWYDKNFDCLPTDRKFMINRILHRMLNRYKFRFGDNYSSANYKAACSDYILVQVIKEFWDFTNPSRRFKASFN